MIYGVPIDQRRCASSGEGEAMQAGDAEHGMVNAFVFEAVVAEDPVESGGVPLRLSVSGECSALLR